MSAVVGGGGRDADANAIAWSAIHNVVMVMVTVRFCPYSTPSPEYGGKCYGYGFGYGDGYGCD